MKNFILLGISLIAPVSLQAFVVDHDSSSVLEKADVQVDVDGNLSSGGFPVAHDAPYWQDVERGKFRAWGQDTIRKEFKHPNLIGLTIFDPSQRSELGRGIKQIGPRNQIHLGEEVAFKVVRNADGSLGVEWHQVSPG